MNFLYIFLDFPVAKVDGRLNKNHLYLLWKVQHCHKLTAKPHQHKTMDRWHSGTPFSPIGTLPSSVSIGFRCSTVVGSTSRHTRTSYVHHHPPYYTFEAHCFPAVMHGRIHLPFYAKYLFHLVCVIFFSFAKK
ncbi:hypothetical protein BX666DRAFT_303286 [Dichotomocladium elegans]|nr:hypothetical protein BX666DRAFT_303286 [Dichotomocladium elegans]